jgi:hypothetical protein
MVDAIGATRYVYNGVGLVTLEDGPWDDDAVSYAYPEKGSVDVIDVYWSRRQSGAINGA